MIRKGGRYFRAMKDIKSMCLSEIEEEFKELLLPKYRARQVYDWLSKGVKNFDEMTNISKSLREMLKSNYVILGVEIEKSLSLT